jgi:iron complex transport system permease protein
MHPLRTAAPKLWVIAALAGLALALHIGVGSAVLAHPAEVLRAILQGPGADDPLSSIVWDIRMPRAIGCALVGALLGAVGAAFQALFRNPLAEPYVIGVSSGAAAGGVLALVAGFGAMAAGLGLMGAAFLGGLGALLLVMSFARRRGVLSVPRLLLAGVVIGAMLAALTTLILLAGGEDANRVLRWLLGSTTPMFWNRIVFMLGVLAIGGWVLYVAGRHLNAYSIGEEHARLLGVDTARLVRRTLVAGTAMAAVAVGATGIIGFLGLVAPHLARRIVGADARATLPAATLTGAALLLAADLVAQRAVPGVEVPVGAVTAILGAPALVILLRARD